MRMGAGHLLVVQKSERLRACFVCERGAVKLLLPWWLPANDNFIGDAVGLRPEGRVLGSRSSSPRSGCGADELCSGTGWTGQWAGRSSPSVETLTVVQLPSGGRRSPPRDDGVARGSSPFRAPTLHGPSHGASQNPAPISEPRTPPRSSRVYDCCTTTSWDHRLGLGPLGTGSEPGKQDVPISARPATRRPPNLQVVLSVSKL